MLPAAAAYTELDFERDVFDAGAATATTTTTTSPFDWIADKSAMHDKLDAINTVLRTSFL